MRPSSVSSVSLYDSFECQRSYPVLYKISSAQHRTHQACLIRLKSLPIACTCGGSRKPDSVMALSIIMTE